MTFDKREYQRLLMRKRRLEDPSRRTPSRKGRMIAALVEIRDALASSTAGLGKRLHDVAAAALEDDHG